MKRVLVIGASGNIAGKVVDLLGQEPDIELTLFVRNARRLRVQPGSNCRIVQGDALRLHDLKEAMADADIVYGNLAGDLEKMARNIVTAMAGNGVKRLIFISSIGIYDEPVKPVLRPYRKAADVIESSNLDYTILRPTWFTNADEVDYEITRKGEPETGSIVSQKSVAAFIVKLIKAPENFVRESVGISKPNS